MKRTELTVLLLVVAIAIVVRFYGLSWTPAGLSADEALNGNTALEATRSGDYKLFYAESSEREGLFINLQAASLSILGRSIFSLRLVSVLLGILTVIGVYVLTRRLFDDWRMAAIASFLMSVGFWHVQASRIGLGDVLSPLCAVWGFYYLYKGIETHRLWHWALSGAFFGFGFYATSGYRVLPLAIACTLIAFWLALRAAFSHGKFLHARHQMLGGVAMMIGIMILLLLPMATNFYANPPDTTNAIALRLDILSADNIGVQFIQNIGTTLAMLLIGGTADWQYAPSIEPVLFWPVAAFFAVGLVHTLWRFVHSWRTRGHPGIVQTMLLSWLFVGLLPLLLSETRAANAVLALPVSPAVYILAAVGLHWLYLALERWYGHSDHSQICLPMRHLPGSLGHRVCVDRSTFVVSFAVLSVLLAIGVGDIQRYFVQWSAHPSTLEVFNSDQHTIAARLLSLPPATLKYVVTTPSTMLVQGIPLSAQPVMFLTDTWSPQQQRERNIYYLTQEQFAQKQFPKGAFVIQHKQAQ